MAEPHTPPSRDREPDLDALVHPTAFGVAANVNRGAIQAEETVELPTMSPSLVELAGEIAGAPPNGTLSAERLCEVLERLKSKFYDRPEVRDQIARRIARDLGSAATEPRPR